MVKAVGYKSLQKQITVTENKITVINVYMAPIRRGRNPTNFWQPVEDGRTHRIEESQAQRLTLTNSALGLDRTSFHGAIFFSVFTSFFLGFQ